MCSALRYAVENGGIAYGAWEDDRCVAIVGVAGHRMGPREEYTELVCFQVRSLPRDKEVAITLFEMAKQAGRRLGASYLYMEADAAVESQHFLREMGARETAWYRPTERGEEVCRLECAVDSRRCVQDVYTHCPEMKGTRMAIRPLRMTDTEDLLRCYRDKASQELFNSDNCRDDFRYQSLAEMEETILFWMDEYEAKEFVRMTVVDCWSGEAVGTIELFHEMAECAWQHYGFLRLDLRSDYEIPERLDELLYLINRYAYDLFHVSTIVTKAVPVAAERIKALERAGYQSTTERFMERYGDYYRRECLHG